MTTILKSAVSALLLGVFALSANAAVISLGTIDKEYGSAAGRGDQASTGGTSCDILNANSITVRDSGPRNCVRFHDTFDFSGMNYKSIDTLSLTLNFSNTNGNVFGLPTEDWRLIIADSAGKSSNKLIDMKNTATGTQQFTINARTHASVFANISENGKFQMWFGDEAFLPNNFQLHSATLEVSGTAVPEPSSVALLSISMLAAAFVRRRKPARSSK